MNKKIISLLLLTILSSTTLVSCGKSDDINTDSSSSNTTSSSEEATKPAQNSKVLDEPTVDTKQVVTISDFKGKDSNAIKSLLGNPTNESNNIATYNKDGYTFEVTYYDSICGQIKVVPEVEMKYPADATNILNVFGIKAGNSDSISPAALSWDNQFDTFNISVLPDDTVPNKLGYIKVILDEQYK